MPLLPLPWLLLRLLALLLHGGCQHGQRLLTMQQQTLMLRPACRMCRVERLLLLLLQACC
jgi:hypothetical protein